MDRHGKMWEVRQEAVDGILEIYIYGDIEQEQEEFDRDDVDRATVSANEFRKMLEDALDVREIRLYINSRGGSVFEGTAIYNQLKRHRAKKVVVIDGVAASIASVIAMAGDVVVMPPNTTMMIHNAWMLAVGNAADLRRAADDLDKINSVGRVAYLEKSGGKLSEDELVRLMDEETWLTADEAVFYGLADVIGYGPERNVADAAQDEMERTDILEKAKKFVANQKAYRAAIDEIVSGLEKKEPENEIDDVKEIKKEVAEELEEKTKTEPQNIIEMLGGFF